MKPRTESEWWPTSYHLTFMVRCNKPTNWQLHSWHPLFHPSPPAPQHRSSLLDLQSHENSTSTKDPLLCFLPGALGIRQQLQTCRKMMAGRIGKLWLLCNKLKHYAYVTAIWEREALLVMAWIRDRKKGKQIWLGVENNLACGTYFTAFIDNGSKTFISNASTCSKMWPVKMVNKLCGN